jgi:hypothetical protein
MPMLMSGTFSGERIGMHQIQLPFPKNDELRSKERRPGFAF